MSTFEEDADQKYRKLSLEFARLRNEIPALREKLEEEKTKNGNLEDEIRKKDVMIRKLKTDNESLNFRNDQLAKRVENLQSSLDSTTATFAQAKATKKHKEANLRLFGSAALEPCTSSDSPVNSSQLVLEQEFERKLMENASLHTKLFDMEKQHETVVVEFTAIVRKLEAENELMKKKLIETAAKGFADPEEDEELAKLMMNDVGDPMKQESAKDMITKLLTDFQKGFEALTQFFLQSDNRSIIYPCDATLESVPEAIHLFGLECGKIAQELKDLTGIIAMVQMRLTDGLNGETYSMTETKEKIVEIKTLFGELLKNTLKELLPNLSVCLRKECEAPWCTPQLDQLNSQFEKIFITSFQRLSNVFNMADYSEVDIQKEVVELKKLFHKLRDIFGKKIFIENHLPAASKKLKSSNDAIEKSLLQFVQIIGKLQTTFEDKNAIEVLTSTLWTRMPNPEMIQNNEKRMTVLEKQASLIEESQTKLNDMKSRLIEFKNREDEFKEEQIKLNQELALKDEKIQELQVKIISLGKQMEMLKDSTAEINEMRSKLMVGKNLDDFAVLEFYFCEELNKVIIELENVRGTISRYRKDIDDMTLVLQKLDAEHRDSKSVIDEKTTEIQRLKDELETTCQNYDEQIRVMSDHLAALNAKVVEKSEQLIQMNGSKESKSSTSNSSNTSNGGSFGKWSKNKDMEVITEVNGQLDLAKIVLVGDEEDLLHPGFSFTLKHSGKRFPSVMHYGYAMVLNQMRLQEEQVLDLLSTPPSCVVARALKLIEENLPAGQDLASVAGYIQNCRQSFILEGYRIRAEQDENFKNTLMQTNDALLIVCDPKDHEMGVGMADKAFLDFFKAGNYKMQDLSDWMLNEHVRPKAVGQNQLGFLLMWLRFELNENDRLKLLKSQEFVFQGLSTDVDEQPMKISSTCHILSLSGFLKPLSNYYKCVFDVKEQTYRSVEHYAYERLFDALGFEENLIQKIRSVPQPADVRHVAEKTIKDMNLEEEEVKRKMGRLDRWRQTAMKHKISKDIELQRLLLNTGNAFLVECNPYGDDVWTANTNEYELQHLLTKAKFDIDTLANMMMGKKDLPPTLKHLGKNKTGILLMELRKKYMTPQFIPYPNIAPPEVNIQRMGPSNNVICFTPESIFHPFYPVPIIVSPELTLPTPIHYVVLFSCRFLGLKPAVEEELMSYLDGSDVWYHFNIYINYEVNLALEKIKSYFMHERHRLLKVALAMMFIQHPAILRSLLETEDGLLVYCSRYSTIESELTSGLRERDFRRLFQETQSDVQELISIFLKASASRPAFLGGNRLGFILMELRRSFTLGGCYPSQYDALPMTMEAKLGTNSPMENYTCDRPFVPMKRINFISIWPDPYILYHKKSTDYVKPKKNMPVLVPEDPTAAKRLMNELKKEGADKKKCLRGADAGVKAVLFNSLFSGLNESLIGAERKLMRLKDVQSSIKMIKEHNEQARKVHQPPPAPMQFPSMLAPPRNPVPLPQMPSQTWRDEMPLRNQMNQIPERKSFNNRDNFRNENRNLDRNRDRRQNYTGPPQNRNGTRNVFRNNPRRYSPNRDITHDRKRTATPDQRIPEKRQPEKVQEAPKPKKEKRVVNESELSEGEILSSDED